MKRAEINEAVEIALAENGYSESFYRWRGAWLDIWCREAVLGRTATLEAKNIYLPSGTSCKRLIERLSTLPAVGAPRPRPRPRPRIAKPIQLDIENAIAATPAKAKGRRRSRDIPAHIGNRAAA